MQLVETAEGVAVVGDSRTTYRNRKQIKAHGARWNKAAKQWQASEPEAVARLREWFGVSDTPTAEKADTANESEPQTDAPTAPTAQGEHMPTTTGNDTEPTEADDTEPPETDSTTDNGTASDNEPQRAEERPDNSKNKPETLNMLKAAARHAEQLTEINEHTEALLARLYVLAAVGMRVRSLIERAKAIEAAQQRGHPTPGEVYDRQRISQETERRAALFLTPEEFRALYRHDPQTDSRAA